MAHSYDITSRSAAGIGAQGQPPAGRLAARFALLSIAGLSAGLWLGIWRISEALL